MSNVVNHETDNKVKVANPKLKRSIDIYGTIAGHLVMKYRCASRLCKSASLHRNVISKGIKEGIGK